MIRFQISKDSSLPLHMQLLDDLRHKIMVGELKPHEQLPGEWELVNDLSISRATIQKAWQSAQEEGLIYRVAGKGTFVADRRDQRNVRSVIGFIIPEYRGTFAMTLLSGAERVLRKQGYTLQFATTDRDIDEENKMVQKLINDGVRGIIMVPARGTAYKRHVVSGDIDIPVVLMDRPLNGVVLPCISSNNYVGGWQAMQHLIELGHRSILFVARPHMDLWSVSERYRAYQDALRQIEIEPQPPFLIGGDREMSSYEAYIDHDDEEIAPLVGKLQNDERPTAVFAVNDWMALKVQRAAVLAGLRNPDDVSIIGFDDLDIAQYQNPPLTTIAQDAALMGAEAARRLLTLIEGEENQSILTLLPTKLVIRGSTAPLK
jgi:GntR family transcriptional regulator, arabinose operon transcriptional repressor